MNSFVRHIQVKFLNSHNPLIGHLELGLFLLAALVLLFGLLVIVRCGMIFFTFTKDSPAIFPGSDRSASADAFSRGTAMGAALYNRSPHCRTVSRTGMYFLLFGTRTAERWRAYAGFSILLGTPTPIVYVFFAVKEDRNINNFPLEFLFNISI